MCTQQIGNCKNEIHTVLQAGAVPRGCQGAAAPSEIFGPLWPQKVQDKAVTCQNYITYPVVQRKSISCVPQMKLLLPQWPPKMKTQNRHWLQENIPVHHARKRFTTLTGKVTN